MKNKMKLLSILLVATTGATIFGQGGGGHAGDLKWDTGKMLKGAAIEARLAQPARFVSGGGFVNPKQTLSRNEQELLSYYRAWKKLHGRL